MGRFYANELVRRTAGHRCHNAAQPFSSQPPSLLPLLPPPQTQAQRLSNQRLRWRDAAAPFHLPPPPPPPTLPPTLPPSLTPFICVYYRQQTSESTLPSSTFTGATVHQRPRHLLPPVWPVRSPRIRRPPALDGTGLNNAAIPIRLNIPSVRNWLEMKQKLERN